MKRIPWPVLGLCSLMFFSIACSGGNTTAQTNPPSTMAPIENDVRPAPRPTVEHAPLSGLRLVVYYDQLPSQEPEHWRITGRWVDEIIGLGVTTPVTFTNVTLGPIAGEAGGDTLPVGTSRILHFFQYEDRADPYPNPACALQSWMGDDFPNGFSSYKENDERGTSFDRYLYTPVDGSCDLPRNADIGDFVRLRALRLKREGYGGEEPAELDGMGTLWINRTMNNGKWIQTSGLEPRPLQLLMNEPRP